MVSALLCLDWLGLLCLRYRHIWIHNLESLGRSWLLRGLHDGPTVPMLLFLLEVYEEDYHDQVRRGRLGMERSPDRRLRGLFHDAACDILDRDGAAYRT